MTVPLQEAIVKSVLSGDTVVLRGIKDPRQERTLSLAFVSAPRLKRDGDEPFAFESRDFLRGHLVGKHVRFRVLYKIPTGANREYGIIYRFEEQYVLPELAVAEGWVKLRDDAGRKDDSEDATTFLEKLQALEARARADSKGVWQESGGRIENSFEIPDTKAFLEEWKGKEIDGIVEKVLSGDRVIARLLLSPTKHVQTMLLMAGIRAPSTKRTNPSDGKEQPAEPFGEEAQQFVDLRLLQRNVKVNVLGVSPNGQLVANIKHRTQGSIVPFLLKSGLARCIDHHSTMLGPEMATLRQAEKSAKDNRQGLWQGHVAPKSSGGQLEAVVSRIQSADTLFLRSKAGHERRINLSSVRQPKPSDPKQAPWGQEAREFLRKKLIGKHVKFSIDGKRPATEGYDEREMATVTFQDKNVGLLLVENGMASVIRHRQDDTDRSPIYDDLLAAEEEARQAQKGIWSPKAPSAKQYVDYSASVDQAKRQLTLLSRQRKVPAIVDYVKSGSRFTVLVPRENAKLTFVLSGIRAPRTARNENEKSEPFGQEALEFTNRRVLQRDVEIDVEDIDKVGGFIGTLYVNRENFAKSLLEEGLASVHAYSAEKSGHANELFAAEQKAKDARKNLWQNYDPSAEEEEESTAAGAESAGQNGDAAASRRKDYREFVVTHVDESGKLKLQQVGTGTAALTELMSAFKNFHINPSNAQSLEKNSPKVGEYVAAQFSEDNEWYRARVRRNDRENKKSEVVYIDYGNSETVPWSRLRPLSQPQFSPQSKLKPQALDAQLSFIQFPGNLEYLADAVHYLQQAVVNGQTLVGNVDAVEKDGTLWVTLFDPQTSKTAEESINADLVGEGLAIVPRKLKAWERSAADVLEALKKRESEAKDEKRGMFEYGDIAEDD